jgi:hypothetical protein
VRGIGEKSGTKEVRRMGELSPSGMREKSGYDGLAGAIWLGAKEMRRGWAAYPLTGLCLLLLGFLVVPSVYGIFEFRGLGAEGQRVEDFCNAFFADCVFMAICAFLGVNALSSPRLLVFRGLPIPARSLVGSRALSLPFALILNVPALFLPAYFFSNLGKSGTSYLWFAGMWIGYGLLASGLVLLIGLTADGNSCVPTAICLGIQLLLALALLEWTAGFGLVGGSAQLARDYGALAAIISVLAGAAAFAILSRATAERLREGGSSS